MSQRSFYLIFFWIFLAVIFLTVPLLAEETNLNLWAMAEKQLYLDYLPSSSPQEALPVLTPFRAGIVDTELPGGSHLTIYGRKVIGIKYTYKEYLNAPDKKPTSSTEVDQKLQAKVKGRIGDRIFVDIDYDDSAPRSEQQKIRLTYRGKDEEFIQEVAFGDIRLSLPRTEFVTYGQSVFGGRVKAKWGDLHLTAIGSVTRGIAETKTFKGKTTFEKKDIADVSYSKHKYFELYYDQEYTPAESGFSYTVGSAEIWIDDQNSTNNDTSVEMTVEPVSGDTAYTGWFDLQYPGEDYAVDYHRGVINFYRSIGDEFVIAVAYQDVDEQRHPSGASTYRMIKRGPHPLYYKYECKNRYYLGAQKIDPDDFLLRILNLSEEVVYDWASPENWVYQAQVDFDFGLVEITRPLSSASPDVPNLYWDEPFRDPFDPEGPNPYPPDPQHRYTLYTEFSHAVDVYLLRPDIVPESERVFMDGQLLKRNEDYLIDYASGFLTFVDPGRITADTEIKVEYEYMPFIGGQATILGGRLEYTPGKRFSLGATYLSQESSGVKEIPHLGFSPIAHQVLEADMQFSLSSNLGSLWRGDLPMELIFAGEIARSFYQPNTFGAAMVEDFESAKMVDETTLNEESWHLGSRPQISGGASRDTIEISNQEIKGEEINSVWSQDEREVLVLDYDFPGADFWDAVTYVISNTGKDYLRMDYLELWVTGGESGETVHLDLGVVSEDIDGDGHLDTEDVNGDGILNPGEDTGIDIGGTLIGENNGILDTEDLNGDGYLNTTENYVTYCLSDYTPEEPDPATGWFYYLIPLKDAANWDQVQSVIKHLRLWVEGGNLKSTLKVAFLAASGNRWEVKDLTLRAVNNYDDPDYDPFSDYAFRQYYEEMYDSWETSEGKPRKDSGLYLELDPISADSGWVQETFLSSRDFTNYETLSFWLHAQSTGAGFYLRVGSDTSDGGNYYEISRTLDWEGWKKISLSLEELSESKHGDPSFRTINQIRAGLSKNDCDETIKIYWSDLFLSGSREKEGLAKRLSLRGDFGDSVSVSGEYKEVESTFHVIGASPKNEELTLHRWGSTLSFWKWMPLSYQWQRKETMNVSVQDTDLSIKEEGKIVRESQDYKVSLILPSWPRFDLRGTNEVADYVHKAERDKTNTYTASLKYTVPLRFFLLPHSVSASCELKDVEKTVFSVPPKTSEEETRKWAVTLPFKPLKNLNFTYSQNNTDKGEEGSQMRPNSRKKSFSLTSRTTFFHLSPQLKFEGSSEENGFSDDYSGQRDANLESKVSLSLPVKPGSFFPSTSWLGNLTYYTSFSVERERIYDDTTVSLDFLTQIGLGEVTLDDGVVKLDMMKSSVTFKQRWQCFSFLDTTVEYSRSEEDKLKEGTDYDINITRWPVISLSLDLNTTPLIGEGVSQKLFSSSRLTLGLTDKETVKERISIARSSQPSFTWKGRFHKPADLSLTLSGKSTRSEEITWGEETGIIGDSSEYKLKLDYYTLFPWGMNIPLLNRIINFKNEIHLSSNLSLETKKKTLTSGDLSEDNEKWSLGGDVAYKVTENVNMKLGLEGTHYQNKIEVGEDYFSYSISARVEIRF